MNRLTKLSRSIKNSVVLITGAASGMGKATAELFADEGAITIATDINKKDTEKVVAKIKENGKEAESLVLDVGSKDSISECVNKIITKYGQIDILINNAGIAIPTKIDSDEYEIFWDKTHDILLKGQVRLNKRVFAFFKKIFFS